MTIPPIETPSMTETTKVLTMLRDGLISHDTRLQNIRTDLNETSAKVTILETKVLIGDGEKELSHAERIRNLENFIEQVKDSLKYWGRFIGGALLLNFLGFLAGIILAVIKFLPLLEKLANKP